VFALPTLYISQGYLPIIRLIIVIIAGAIGYIGVIWIVERESLLKVAQIAGVKRGITKSSVP
jgi:hypothetical protein